MSFRSNGVVSWCPSTPAGMAIIRPGWVRGNRYTAACRSFKMIWSTVYRFCSIVIVLSGLLARRVSLTPTRLFHGGKATATQCLTRSTLGRLAYLKSEPARRVSGPAGRRLEQLIHSRQQREAGIRRRVFRRVRITGCKLSTAVAASNAFAQIDHANLEPSAAGRTFLDEVSDTRHGSPPAEEDKGVPGKHCGRSRSA